MIIDHIFKNIGITNHYLVGLGAGACQYSTMSNTRVLVQSGWKGFGVDIGNKGEGWIIERFMRPDNVPGILAEQNTPPESGNLPGLQYEDGYTWNEKAKYGYSFTAGVKLLGEFGYRLFITSVIKTCSP